MQIKRRIKAIRSCGRQRKSTILSPCSNASRKLTRGCGPRFSPLGNPSPNVTGSHGCSTRLKHSVVIFTVIRRFDCCPRGLFLKPQALGWMVTNHWGLGIKISVQSKLRMFSII